MLKCSWCGKKEIIEQNKRSGGKTEIKDENAISDLKQLRHGLPGGKFYMHKTCRANFDFQRENPLCHGCRHRKTKTTTKAIQDQTDVQLQQVF